MLTDQPEQPFTTTTPHNRWYRWQWPLLCIGLALGLWVWGEDRVPADVHAVRVWQYASRAPFRERPFPTDRETPLVLASFNIHSAKGRDGQTDLLRVRQTLGQFDLAGLFEVRGPNWFQARDQAHDLIRLPFDGPELRSLYVPTERRWGLNHFGNAVLDSSGQAEVSLLPLEGTRGKAFRMVNWCRVPWRGRELSVMFVHVDSQDDRARQLAEVLEMFTAAAEPAVLLGDFNTRPTDSVLTACIARDDVVDLLVEGSSTPMTTERIDGALGRGVICRAARLVDNPASDHPLVVVELSDIEPRLR